jgi:hypothetical protein
VQHDGGAGRCLVARSFAAKMDAVFRRACPSIFFQFRLRESGVSSVGRRGLRSIRQCIALMSRRREQRISASYSLVALLGETSSSQTMTSLVSIFM